MKPLVRVVAAALVNSASEILLAQRPLHKEMGGLWEFPGGKIEAGESDGECLARELREELGIELHPVDFPLIGSVGFVYDSFKLSMRLYLIDEWEGEPKPLEHLSLQWVSIDKISRYPMPPADLPLLAPLADLMAQRP